MAEAANTRATHHVGLIGADIGGSLSPALHETEAGQLGISYRYTLLDLDSHGMQPADAGALVQHAFSAGYTGLNITHPCKQVVLSELDELSDDAGALGAVNTIVIHKGQSVGHNTDHAGFARALGDGLPSVPRASVTIVGAGGAGSATAYALLNSGARFLAIADVEPRNAVALSDRLTRAFPSASVTQLPVGEIPDALNHVDGIVNASPIGMAGYPGLPFETSNLQPRHWVADVVYRPRETELVNAARAAGCAVLDGGAMLVAQAAETLELVTGVTPSLTRMRSQLQNLLATDPTS